MYYLCIMNEEIIKMLLRGERPESMDYKQFRIKRKAVQQFLKKRRNGRN